MKKILILLILLNAVKHSWGQGEFETTKFSVEMDSTFILREYLISKHLADSAYQINDYISAIQIYEELLQKGEAAEIYYNLGNCYYKVDNIAKAILNYERALLLQPGNENVRINLELANAKTIDKIVAIPDVFFVSWIENMSKMMSSDSWAKISVVFFIFLLILLGFYFFIKSSRFQKIGFIGAILCFFVVLVANIFAFQLRKRLLSHNEAIVLLPSVIVRSTPSDSGTSLFILHEGTKVNIKDNLMHEWKEIVLEDGKVGWIPSSAIEII